MKLQNLPDWRSFTLFFYRWRYFQEMFLFCMKKPAVSSYLIYQLTSPFPT